MARLEAYATPALLSWARDSLGLDEATAAKRVGVDVKKLRKWEGGTARPTFTQLRKLADVYRRPLAVFFLAKPPEDVEVPPDFRSGGTAPGDASPALRLAIRQAHERREAALELSASIGEEPPAFVYQVEPSVSTEEAGARVRAILGIEIDEQLEWGAAYTALGAWRRALEGIGVLVFQASRVKVGEMRAFSIFDQRFPIIAINSSDAPNGRIFSLFHEFAHLLTRSGGLCAFREDDTDGVDIERRCNEIAAHALVPAASVRAELVARAIRGRVGEGDLAPIANRFSVSAAVIVRRLYDLQEVPEKFYKAQMRRLTANVPVSKGGQVPIENKAVASLGGAFIRLAHTSYTQGGITLGELGDLLGVKVKYIDRVIQRAAKAAAADVEMGE